MGKPKKAILIQIRSSGSAFDNRNVRDFGVALSAEAKGNGGTATSFYADGVLMVTIAGLPEESVTAMLEPFLTKASRSKRNVQVLRIDDVILRGQLPKGLNAPVLVQQKLTKGLINSLPDGAYVVVLLQSETPDLG